MAEEILINCETGEKTLAEMQELTPFVPESVTMRQARLALLAAGLLDGVDAAIDSLPSPQREAARIEWEYATEVRRDSPLVATIGAARGLSEEDQNDLFFLAAGL